MKRNLHYFLYPLKGSIWGWNVEQIRPYLPAFNGRKFITVAEDGGTEPIEAVRAKFLDDPTLSFVRVRNDPKLGQVIGFLDVMHELRSLDPDEITFYAHAKGVSHWMPTVACVMAHAEAMYQVSLHRIDLVERVMARHAFAGPFCQTNGDGTSWLFAGAYYWFKHSDVFSKDWRDVPQNRWGVEDYPARHFKAEEAFNLTLGKYFGDLYQTAIPKEEVRRVLEELPAAVDQACGAVAGGNVHA